MRTRLVGTLVSSLVLGCGGVPAPETTFGVGGGLGAGSTTGGEGLAIGDAHAVLDFTKPGGPAIWSGGISAGGRFTGRRAIRCIRSGGRR